MNGARDQLLAGSGLAQDQNGGVGGRNGFHLSQDLAELRAVADNLTEIRSVRISSCRYTFFGQLILELRDFLVSGGVLMAMAACPATWLRNRHPLR